MSVLPQATWLTGSAEGEAANPTTTWAISMRFAGGSGLPRFKAARARQRPWSVSSVPGEPFADGTRTAFALMLGWTALLVSESGRSSQIGSRTGELER